MERALSVQVPTGGDLFAVLAWLGLVLVGLAVLMTLLDWGDISGVDPVPPPRRRPALVLAVVGAACMVLGEVGVLLAG